MAQSVNRNQSAFASDALYQTEFNERDNNGKLTGRMNRAWIQNFQKAAEQFNAPVSLQFPATSADPGAGGMISTDGTYLYVFSKADNAWKRILLGSF